MRRTRLKPISKRRAGYAALATENFADAHGVFFSEVRLILGEDRSRWPKVRRVRDAEVCAMMHKRFINCWNCDEYCGFGSCLECHHLFAGSRTRSDEMTAIVCLCGDCHRNVNTPALPTGRLLYLKWLKDRQQLSWLRLTLLCGHFLPDMIPDEESP